MIKYRKLRWSGYVAKMGEGRSAFKMLTAKPTEKSHLGKSWYRWEENIRIDIKEMGANTGNWVNSVDSAQYRDYYRALVKATFHRTWN